MVNKEIPDISIKQQCRILHIHRSGLYYKPVEMSSKDLEMMLNIDKFHLLDPTLGTRRMMVMLNNEGYSVGRAHIRTLMKKMRIKVMYRRPRTTISDPTKYKYPYLLGNLDVVRANQVWAIDITYIPMKKGFMYLCAIIDLYSRYIVNWSISNSMDAEWVVRVVREAVETHGKPDIINSDQGSQFTSDEYVEYVKSLGSVQISMDGKGRFLDNVYIERFWRTIKYDKIYIYPPSDGLELFKTCQEFVNYYNNTRPHESLDYKQPVVFFKRAS
jgi:putative transposase